MIPTSLSPLLESGPFGALVAAIVFAAATNLLCRFLPPAERLRSALGAWLGRLSVHKRLTVLSVFFLVIVARLILVPLIGLPRPAIPDEFSYLLMGETFAQGRMANLAHPLAWYFETLFVLQSPTYSSIYPVAQGVILATGALLTGHPWGGVLFSVALMAGGICWMMQAWLPPKWALLGAVLAVLQIGLNSYWINSYWGGAHAAIGGALLLGAAGRMRVRQKLKDSFAAAAGLAILFNSRPYEGLALAVLLVIAIAGTYPRKQAWRMLAIPFAVVLAPVLLGMLIYNRQVTGDLFLLPSQLYIKQYATVPIFFWQKLPVEPAFRFPEIRDAMLSFVHDYRRYDTAAGVLRVTAAKALHAGNFFLGPALFLPVVMLPWLWRQRKSRLLILSCGSVFLALSLVVPFEPHYAAPATAALFALQTQALRILWLGRGFARGVSRLLVPCVPAAAFFALVLALPSAPLPGPFAARERAEAWLLDQPGQHLVVVHYSPAHDLRNEWVYNHADLEQARVIWARDTGDAGRHELARHFGKRRIWVVNADEGGLPAEWLQASQK